MEQIATQLPFFDSLPLQEQKVLKELLATDASLQEAFQQWQYLEDSLRTSLNANVPDRNILVLYALAQTDATLLSANEHQQLKEATPKLERALVAYPALQTIIQQIQAEATAFDEIWETESQPARVYFAFSNNRIRMASIAAIFALFAIIAVLVVNNRPENTPILVQTGAMENKSITLADGSVVHLMPNSSLSYDSNFDRKVTFSGQGFFDITHDASHAFEVLANDETIEVLGTQFGVTSSVTSTEVVLASGKVRLTSDTKIPVILAPGEMSTVIGNEAPSTPTAINLASTLTWSPVFFFGGQSLEEAIATVEKHYDVSIAIALDNPAFTFNKEAVFNKATTVETLLKDMLFTIGATVETNGSDSYTIR